MFFKKTIAVPTLATFYLRESNGKTVLCAECPQCHTVIKFAPGDQTFNHCGRTEQPSVPVNKLPRYDSAPRRPSGPLSLEGFDGNVEYVPSMEQQQ